MHKNIQRANIYTDTHKRTCTHIHALCMYIVLSILCGATHAHTYFYNLVLISQGINSLCMGITHALRAAILPHLHTLLAQFYFI